MSKFLNLTKEELIALAEKQEAELASKKYGLVWDAEREPEQVVLDCEHHLPVLKRVKGKDIKTALDQGDNILIEGDNYHALTTLNYTHQGKIDVIYIDPPYNTGNKDFKYNDKFVDKEDGFRHSKWLNFMEKRLRLAKDLLTEKGVIFISIDDNEQAHLKMMCISIFGEDNFIEQFIWQKAFSPKNDARYFSTSHEYILCFAKKKESFKRNLLVRTEKQNNQYKNPDNDIRGPWVSTSMLATTFSKNYVFEISAPNGKKHLPPEGRCWRYSKEKVFELIKDNRIYFGINGNNVPRTKRFLSEVLQGVVPQSILTFDLVGSGQDGTNNLRNIFEGSQVFDFPKPVNLIKFITLISSNNESVILDFMAGSGTTGHAVLDLNKEDGGNRRFILCTNNENNICEDVTYPRLQKVIKGYKKNGDGEKNEGLNGNLQYFKTDLIKKTGNKDQMRINLTQKCTDMLCVKENIFNLETEHDDYKIFSSNQKDQFLCVYYNFYDESFDEFLKEVKKLKGHKKIYMFSMDGKVEKGLFKGISDFDLEEIPQKIIDIYKQLVKMNIPVKAETIFLDFEKAQKKVFEDQEKDEGARVLRIVLEKSLQKIAQKNGISILDDKGKEQKIALVNDQLKDAKIISKVVWEENKTYLAIGNHASHGDYDEYDLKKVENFYKHIQELHNIFGI